MTVLFRFSSRTVLASVMATFHDYTAQAGSFEPSSLTFALQALLHRHESYMAEAEEDRHRLVSSIDDLERCLGSIIMKGSHDGRQHSAREWEIEIGRKPSECKRSGPFSRTVLASVMATFHDYTAQAGSFEPSSLTFALQRTEAI
jgi:hypothetical protein